MKRYYAILNAVVLMLLCLITLSFAEIGYEKFFGDNATTIPAGWSNGKKTGWDGQKLPPGLYKKSIPEPPPDGAPPEDVAPPEGTAPPVETPPQDVEPAELVTVKEAVAALNLQGAEVVSIEGNVAILQAVGADENIKLTYDTTSNNIRIEYGGITLILDSKLIIGKIEVDGTSLKVYDKDGNIIAGLYKPGLVEAFGQVKTEGVIITFGKGTTATLKSATGKVDGIEIQTQAGNYKIEKNIMESYPPKTSIIITGPKGDILHYTSELNIPLQIVINNDGSASMSRRLLTINFNSKGEATSVTLLGPAFSGTPNDPATAIPLLAVEIYSISLEREEGVNLNLMFDDDYNVIIDGNVANSDDPYNVIMGGNVGDSVKLKLKRDGSIEAIKPDGTVIPISGNIQKANFNKDGSLVLSFKDGAVITIKPAPLPSPTATLIQTDSVFFRNGWITFGIYYKDSETGQIVRIQLFDSQGNQVRDLQSVFDSLPGVIWRGYYLANSNSGDIWYSDEFTNDGFNHFRMGQDADGDAILYIEDLPGGGDQDFNDYVVEIKHVFIPLPMPLPTGITLIQTDSDFFDNGWITFGIYYKDSETGQIVRIQLFDSQGNQVRDLQSVVNSLPAGTFIGYYLANSNSGNIWYTDKNLNSDGFEHFRIEDGPDETASFILKIEDLPGGGDQDFNDWVVEIKNYIYPLPVIPWPGHVPEYVPGEVIVGIIKGSEQQFFDAVSKLGGTILPTYSADASRFYLIKLPDNMDILQAIEYFKSFGNVRSAEPNGYYTIN